MPKIGEYIKSIFKSNTNTTKPEIEKKFVISRLESDAAPMPDNNDGIEEIYESPTNSSIDLTLIQAQRPSIVSTSSQNDSLPPLKQHYLAELANLDNQNNLQVVNPTNDSLIGSNNQYPINQLATSVHNTQAQNVIQISHANGVHIGNAYSISNSISPPSTETSTSNRLINDPSKLLKKTRTTVEMMKSDDELEHRYLDVISKHLANYRDIARKLNFSDAQITHFELDNHIHGTNEIIYQILLDWKRNTDDANLGLITKILWKYGNQELVNIYLKDMYKIIKKEQSNETVTDET